MFPGLPSRLEKDLTDLYLKKVLNNNKKGLKVSHDSNSFNTNGSKHSLVELIRDKCRFEAKNPSTYIMQWAKRVTHAHHNDDI